MISAQMDSRLCGNDDGESCASVGKYKMYPEYKDSGVEWLGDVPENWGSTQIKYGYQITLGKMLQKEAKNHDDVLKPYLKSVNIQPDGISVEKIEQMWFSPSDISSLRLKNGDVLISEGGDVGRSAIWKEELPECYIQNAINRARPFENNSSAFLHYWMHMLKSSDFIQIICNKATIAHYTAEKVESSPLFLPSDTEARSIANFLDHETAKIDTLIEEQQSLIRLLKEKRQAVISHAVTKGLNPDAPMKDSGVEWLGEVPEHWVIAQLKFNTLDMQTGPFGSQLHAEDYVDGGIPLVNPVHMKDGIIIADSKVSVDEKTWHRLRRHQLSEDEIVFARRGELGRCAIVTNEQKGWLCGTGSLKAKLNHRLLSKYSYLLITSEGVISDMSLESKGSTMDNLNTETLGKVRLPLPPIAEQQEILGYVDEVSGKFRELVNDASSAIELMQERRTALISAAVTGKIDVRDWSPLKK